MNISAALLVVWYCMSIIGFDVHTCMSSGRTFISSFAESTTCADVHPEHHCCGSSCCSGYHHEASCCSSEHCDEMPAEQNCTETVGSRSCCSNDYQVILLSGCRADNDSDDKYSFSNISYTFIEDISAGYIAMARYHAEHIQFLEPDSGVLSPGDFCATFGVWRI